MHPRHLLPLLFALAALPALSEDPPVAADDTAAKVLEKVNSYRKLAGQSAVRIDEAFSKGCQAHADYLKSNQDQPSTKGLGAHNEDAKLPGYTVEGEKAGQSADLSFDEPVASVDRLMGTLFHRVPLLDPSLEKIGFGAANDDKNWFVVIDVMSGRKAGKAGAKGPQPVLYPKDKQKEVPAEFSGELPNPIPDDRDGRAGYPITAQFPSGIPVKEASVGVKDADGKLLDCWVTSPEKPADARYQRNTICAMPKDVLKPGATYTVMMAAKVGGRPWSAEWKFTTEGVAEVKPPDKK